jgi:hypothetical protein
MMTTTTIGSRAWRRASLAAIGFVVATLTAEPARAQFLPPPPAKQVDAEVREANSWIDSIHALIRQFSKGACQPRFWHLAEEVKAEIEREPFYAQLRQDAWGQPFSRAGNALSSLQVALFDLQVAVENDRAKCRDHKFGF